MLEEETAQASSPTTVLIVEDDPDVRTVTKLLLEQEGCSVIEAGDGLEAVHIAVVRSLDLILMDINMPIMDGIEATRQLRQDDRTRAVPIVIVSADTDERLRKAMDAGCNGCVKKPLLPDNFKDTLEKYVHS